MGYCKKYVTPLLTDWSYAFLALTHPYGDKPRFAVKVFLCPRLNPSGAENGIFRSIPWLLMAWQLKTRPSAAMVLTMQDIQVLAFYDGGFQWCVPPEVRHRTKCKYIFLFWKTKSARQQLSCVFPGSAVWTNISPQVQSNISNSQPSPGASGFGNTMLPISKVMANSS